MSEQKFEDLPLDNVSLLAWELAQFPASDRGTLMRDAICRPGSAIGNFSDIEALRISFDDYWQEIFGVRAPQRELGFYVDMLSTIETGQHFRRLNETITDQNIDAALRCLVVHLFEGIRALRQFQMN